MPDHLTSADLSQRLDAARLVEAEAIEGLRQLQVAAVAADVDDSPEERSAAAALAKATEAVSRLEAAYSATLAAERSRARQLATADRAARDAQTVKAAEALEAAATAMDRAAETYAKAWLRLVETARTLQTEIGNRQDALRRDLHVPPLGPLVENKLYALTPFHPTVQGDAAPAPGARSNGLVRDVARIPSVADAVSSLADAVRLDIEAARARQPALEPAEGW